MNFVSQTKATRGVPGPEAEPLLKRWARFLLHRYTTRNERMRVCETLSLGGRRALVLVECDGQRFLAGLSAGGVESLIAIDRAGDHA